jgi:hypothetical protein
LGMAGLAGLAMIPLDSLSPQAEHLGERRAGYK